MGSELKFSTTNHPQTDEQTKRINVVLEDYLRHYVTANQKNWLDLLDAAQFAYNLHKSSSTRMSPFELAMGQQPLTLHEIAKQRSWGRYHATYRFAINKQKLMQEAQDNLLKVQRRMKKCANKGRRPLEFQFGDKVLLKLTPQTWRKFINEAIHRGLIPKYDGPFEIVKRVGVVAYKLKLPKRLQIHPTIHVSFLKPYHGDAEDPTRNEARRASPIVMV